MMKFGTAIATAAIAGAMLLSMSPADARGCQGAACGVVSINKYNGNCQKITNNSDKKVTYRHGRYKFKLRPYQTANFTPWGGCEAWIVGKKSAVFGWRKKR